MRSRTACNPLKDIRSQFSELGPFAFLEFDVRCDWLRPKTADDVIKAVRGGIDVGIIDLVGITGENDFGAMANPRDDGLGLEGREVLCLVDDHELIGDALPAT